MDFHKELSERVEATNNTVKMYLPEPEKFKELIVESARYSVEAGGKRLRPLIVSEAFTLCGGGNADIKPFMAAIEFIHSYSLVHDDLPAMDNDDYRRGRLTTHKKYGEDFGILAGDALLNLAYEVLTEAVLEACGKGADYARNAAKASAILAKKAGIHGMVGGQALDVYLTGKDMDRQQLEFIFNLKTGALIEAAFMMGGALAGVSDDTLNLLEKAGNLVGVAFQIQDDILDICGNEADLGKPVHSDERNCKNTYVSLYGMEAAKAAVSAKSAEAVDIIRNIGENDFLIQLIEHLINRIK
jgi:geranylgeranyl diphosphate synthase type II